MTNYELPQMKYSEHKGLISIIVPIYNTEKNSLRECLDSILSQTFTHWEAILVNDGSTDNTRKIIDEYAKKDSRFVTVHKQNQGTLLARKTGLENSKGEFIANIDHDDTYNLQFLEKMLAKITETNADFVWCDFNKPNHITDYNWNSDVSKNVAITLSISQGMALYTWNKLIKRKIYVNVLFPNTHLVLGEDPVQGVQIAYHSKAATFVPENLYFHKGGGVSAVSSKKNTTDFIQSAIYVNKLLENFFYGAIPENVEDAFYCQMFHVALIFFLLSKNERQIFVKELEPLLPGLIKHDRRLCFKICCFLANKGVEFPITLLRLMRKIRNLALVKLKNESLTIPQKFVTLFPQTKNVHLIKDVGMIGYILHRYYGYNSKIVCYKNDDKYNYLDNEVKGLEIEFIKKNINSTFDVFFIY